MTAESQSQSSPPSPIIRGVHYDVEAGQGESIDSSHRPFQTRHTFQSEADVSDVNVAPILKRRQTRQSTTHTFRTVQDFPSWPNWHPGQEPGLDPSKPNGGRAQEPSLHTDCEITVVDYSEDDMVMYHLTNATLPGWLEKEGEKAEWVKCRFINVNGLSWDVIQELGKYKKLHRLALEDLLNTRNRTKADWYSDHTYIVLTLQKLVHIHPEDEDEDDEGDEETHSKGERILSRRQRFNEMIHRIFGVALKHDLDGDKLDGNNSKGVAQNIGDAGYFSAHTDGSCNGPIQKLRTIQRYHGGPNKERMAFMEAKSALTARNRAVCAEQVSIFLTSDNTVISFFEASADDIETPILTRLSTPDTILRRSCDASMLTQAIIDAIIDLAIPVTAIYQDVIGELELDVLTEPALKHTKSLYIVTSEITTMRNFVSPIINLIKALRDHKAQPVQASVLPDKSLKPATGIEISAMSRTYLGDVEDHCFLIVEALDQMHGSAAGMIDLIFNTISAYQNDSMRSLTIVTVLFLPMSFLTGYFGMNFHTFNSLDNDEAFFWSIALPVAFGVGLFLMRNVLWRWSVKTVQRRGISKRRKGRLMKEKQWARKKNG